MAHLASHLLAAGCLLQAGALSAAIVVVDTTDDEIEDDGDCSLREAILTANFDAPVDACTEGSGKDVILVPAGTYTLTRSGTDDTGVAGDLDLLTDMEIAGLSSDGVIVQSAVSSEAVFHVVGGDVKLLNLLIDGSPAIRTGDDVQLELEDCVVEGATGAHEGVEVDDRPGSPPGQPILRLVRTTVRDNNDGGIHLAMSAGAGGRVEIEGSTISNNGGTGVRVSSTVALFITNTSIAHNGGGIGAAAPHGVWVQSGRLTLAGSEIRDHDNDNEGAGVWVVSDQPTTIQDSVFDGNTSSFGGGLYVQGSSTTIEGCAFLFNRGNVAGGGVWAEGLVTIRDTLFRGNVSDSGGAVVNANGWSLTVEGSHFEDNGRLGALLDGTGGAITNEGLLAVSGSSFVANGSRREGGALWNAGNATVSDSTFSGNTAGMYGGAIWVESSGLELINVTIVDNIADDNGDGDGDGGGLAVAAGASAFVRNTVIAENEDLTPAGPDCSGSISSFGHNLFGELTGCTVTGSTTDRAGLSPELGPLVGHPGRITLARQPGPLSPLLDAGSPLAPGSGGGACTLMDQWGQVRPRDDDDVAGARCDIGAVEGSSLFADGFETGTVERWSSAVSSL
jgi:CSLREA domain-containing protein